MLKSRLKQIEKVTLVESLHRILAQDVMADRDDPPCNVSPIDGIALRYLDRESGLWNIAKIDLGDDIERRLNKNECIEVSKGAKLPFNCDIVCSSEQTYIKDGQTFIDSDQFVKIVKMGSSYRKGELLLKSGQLINAKDLTTLAKNNFLDVNVFAKLNVYICFKTEYFDSMSFNISDHKVRDFVSPYIEATLNKLMNFVSEPSMLDVQINIVNSLDTETCEAIIYSEDSFIVYIRGSIVHIDCTSNLPHLDVLLRWLVSQLTAHKEELQK